MRGAFLGTTQREGEAGAVPSARQGRKQGLVVGLHAERSEEASPGGHGRRRHARVFKFREGFASAQVAEMILWISSWHRMRFTRLPIPNAIRIASFCSPPVAEGLAGQYVARSAQYPATAHRPSTASGYTGPGEQPASPQRLPPPQSFAHQALRRRANGSTQVARRTPTKSSSPAPRSARATL